MIFGLYTKLLNLCLYCFFCKQVDAKNGEPQSFIFATKESFSPDDKLLVLIHGSGAVRAGQWHDGSSLMTVLIVELNYLTSRELRRSLKQIFPLLNMFFAPDT